MQLKSYANKFLAFIKDNILSRKVFWLLLGGMLGFLIANNRHVRSYTVSQGVSAPATKESSESVAANVSPGSITVDLEGAVSHPGLYSIPEGSRVGDLLHKANGLSEDSSADWVSKDLNLAQKLTDSEKIYVPFDWETYNPDQSYKVLSGALNVPVTTGSAAVSTTASTVSGIPTTSSSDKTTKTNVNTASSADLDLLPGIGTAYAGRIIANRLYTDFDNFVSKSTIPSSTCDKLKDLITF
jgi:competence protein ComEA